METAVHNFKVPFCTYAPLLNCLMVATPEEVMVEETMTNKFLNTRNKQELY